ncbi:mandelate racemase/muconate lactonizing enzyme family protein, partial [Verrucomicrobiota bacterium]
KIGRDPEEDMEIVRAVREAVGPKANIRIDPNQAWSSSYAVRMIRKLEEYRLEFVEQPVPRWDVEGLCAVRGKVDTPICACELAWDHKDIFEIIRNRAADIINVDIHRAGGILECKKQIHAAQIAGLPCGLHTSGSFGPGTAAALHLAASSVNMPLAIELIYDWFADDIITSPFQMTPTMKVPESPGLGVELDEEKLKRYMEKEITEGWTTRSTPVEIPIPPPRFWL